MARADTVLPAGLIVLGIVFIMGQVRLSGYDPSGLVYLMWIVGVIGFGLLDSHKLR